MFVKYPHLLTIYMSDSQYADIVMISEKSGFVVKSNTNSVPMDEVLLNTTFSDKITSFRVSNDVDCAHYIEQFKRRVKSKKVYLERAEMLLDLIEE